MGLPEPRHIKIITPKPPRLSIVLFFIMAVLFALATPLRGTSQPPITFRKFFAQMLKHHDVERVVAYKSGDLLNVEVYLKKESLNKPEYANAEKGSSPQYVLTEQTFDSL